MRIQEYAEAAQAFAEAAVEPNAWHGALRRLSSATGSDRAELIGVGAASATFYVAEAPTESYHRQFDEAVGYSPLTNPRVAAGLRAAPMQVVPDREYDALLTNARTAAYRECVGILDIPYGCQTTLVRRPDRLVGMSVLRSARQGRVGPDEAATFASLAPHALAAVQTRLALGERSLQDMVLALEHAEAAAFFCDVDGTVQAMTGRAEALVAGAGPLTLRRGRLTATHPEDVRAFHAALGVARRRSDSIGNVVLGRQGARAVAHVRALDSGDWAGLFRPSLLVIVKQRAGSPSAEVLRAAFGFTTAEAEIALAMCAGHPRERIALQRGVSLGTLRQQVKAIYAKAGVSREADLILAVQGLG